MKVGAISCNNCSIGYVSIPDRTGCICSKGFYYDNLFNCKKCPNGTYSNVEGAQSYFNCSAGYTSNDNHTDYIPCPMGYYSNISGSTCEKCPIGYYSNTNGLTSCKACDAGSTSNEERSFCI